MLVRKHLLLSAGLLALATVATPAFADGFSIGLSYSGGNSCYSIGRAGGFISFGRPSYDCYDTRTIYGGYTRYYDSCVPSYRVCTPVYRDCDTRVIVRESPRRRVVRRHYQRYIPRRTIVRHTYSPHYTRVSRSHHTPRYHRSWRHAPTRHDRHHRRHAPSHRRIVRYRR